MCEAKLYGKCCLFDNIVEIIKHIGDIKDGNIDLTLLRLLIIENVANNLLKFTNPCQTGTKFSVYTSLDANHGNFPAILCGPVISENGVKDSHTSAANLFKKRAADMRMIAQHRYRVKVSSTTNWDEYFATLGTASVTLEMLSNKPHKQIKISLNDLSGTNKGPAFIFYNCARLSVLLAKFERKVNENIYPSLPPLDRLGFASLNQPEEWELLYVYILQFPMVIRNCVRSIEKGVLNPQHLITFLSNMSSVFSIYYRRVRILIEPRPHLFGIIHSRIYLLKALQHVFHNALAILNIEPINEM